MALNFPRTKIVATLGPASSSPEMLRELIHAGMSVARLNFSHGRYEDHIRTVVNLRTISEECDTPVTLLQDLQGPKIRVGQLRDGQINLVHNGSITLLPDGEYQGQSYIVPIDYPGLAMDAEPGAQVLLDDGLIELRVEAISGTSVMCRILEGGILKSRKGVVLPHTHLRIPPLTEKDQQDVAFGISQDVDWIALSFVRHPEDVRTLKTLLAHQGAAIPVMAKIETPQALANLDAILDEVNGLMVARGDLGVEMSPEKVPIVQKRIIRSCNEREIPVITATQMLESMIQQPQPTRAEASDVANAILDGTDCVMLSGESAIGKYPVKAVEMMARIAREVEPHANFSNRPPAKHDETHALSQAITAIDRTLNLRCIVAFTTTGYSARLVSSQRPRAPVIALTPNDKVYHALNLLWGVKPLLRQRNVATYEELVHLTEAVLQERKLARHGDKVLIVGGLPMGKTGGTNFVKVHTIESHQQA